MSTQVETMLRKQLSDRRHKLQAAASNVEAAEHLSRLLAEVDAALERANNGTYGLCEVCHEPIEADRLCADPLLRFCLDHLSPAQQRALEHDLELASRIQTGLLPQPDLRVRGWQVAYHYQAAGPVSGDYCDLVNGKDENLYFLLGDVSGKGVAASLLMSHLHGLFRTLISTALPLRQILEQASRVFCESTLLTHFATLVCGIASASGHIEIGNAGHLPPLRVQGDTVARIDGTSLPLGLFCDEQFTSQELEMERGDSLILYTDGVSEALDASGNEYGIERLMARVREFRELAPSDLIRSLLADLRDLQSGRGAVDDASLMVIRRTE